VERGSPSDYARFSTAAINFIKSIIFHFGEPHNIIIDNGTNFTSKEFKNYCEGMGIKLKFVFVAHPKTNGQVKKANGCRRGETTYAMGWLKWGPN
jgi:hypothetical protein